jgi:hypothetical protein
MKSNRLAVVLATGLILPSPGGAQQSIVSKPVAEKKLAELPPGPLFWSVENSRRWRPRKQILALMA